MSWGSRAIGVMGEGAGVGAAHGFVVAGQTQVLGLAGASDCAGQAATLRPTSRRSAPRSSATR
jgi:hypothetical protein